MARAVGIGIDIGEDQIRVVKLRRTGRGTVLQSMGSLATPEGAIVGGSVANSRLLADALRRALKIYEIKGSEAVVGLPGRAAASRVLELPTMAREELRAVVAGEMEHYRMIPLGQGTFDFVALGEPSDNGRRQRILVMAAEARVVDGYREGLRLSGLQLMALETVSLAAARAVYPALERGGVALIAVGPRTSEFAVFHSGQLRYLRQLDVGSVELARVGSSSRVRDATGEAPPDAPLPFLPRLDGTTDAAESFAYEVQRSVHFYHREMPESARVDRVLLCVDTERVHGLEEQLQSALGLPVSLCNPFQGMLYSESRFNPDTMARVGSRYSPAVGLALRATEETPRAPRMDLSLTGPESRLARKAPRCLTWGLAASIAAVLAVLIAWFGVQRTLQRQRAELAAAKAELIRVSKVEQERTSAANRAREARQIVQLRGLPWSEILFQVSAFMPERVWLTSLQLDAGNTLTLEGMALSATSVAALMESFARSSLFSGPQMSSITKATSSHHSLVKYQVKVAVGQPTPQTPRPPPAVAEASRQGETP